MIRRQRGVTLMELMVVMTIIGILAAIAYPSYRAQVRRSNRTEARVALEQTAGALEKCYTRYMRYDDFDNCPVANQLEDGSFDTPQAFYRITANPLNGTQFTVTATALNGQLDDTDCRTLTLGDTSARGATDASGATSAAIAAACWR
jgi:type IV pilus assembly protein PilE